MSRSRRAVRFVALPVFLLVLGLAAGCGDDGESTDTTQPSEVSATTSATVSEPIVLDKITGAASANDAYYILDQQIAERIEQETGGKVKINVHLGGTLCPPLESFEAVLGGTGDIVGGNTGYSPQRFGLTGFAGNCLHRLPSAEVSTTLLWEIYENTPEIQNEWTDWKILWANGQTPGNFHLRERAETLADLEGRQIRMPGDQGVYGTALGAVPVSMPLADMYQALEKGIVDGVWCGAAELKVSQLAEITPFSLVIPVSTGVVINVMPIETWNSLPDDVQAVFESVSAWAQEETYKISDAAFWDGYEYAETLGHERVEPAPDEMLKILKALHAADLTNAEGLTEKGKPAMSVLEAARQAEDKYADLLLWSDIWSE